MSPAPIRVPAAVRALLEELPPGAALDVLEVYAPDELELGEEGAGRYYLARRYLLQRRAVAALEAHAGRTRRRADLPAERAADALAAARRDLADARAALAELGWFRAGCGGYLTMRDNSRVWRQHGIEDVREGEICEECRHAGEALLAERERDRVIDLAARAEALPAAWDRRGPSPRTAAAGGRS